MKSNKVFFWACDYSSSSGEGRLARLFIKEYKKKIKCSFINLSKPTNNFLKHKKFTLNNNGYIYIKNEYTSNINDKIDWIVTQSLLKNLKRAGSLEGDYHKLGINMSQDYGKIMSGVNAQRLNNFPIKISKKDVKSILLTDE